MATKTWLIEQLTCTPKQDSTDCTVFNIAWRLNGELDTHFATVYGSLGVSYAEGDPYTPFADLTKDQVIGWVKTALGEEGVAAYETSIDKQIADQINPPTLTPVLPWNVTQV